MDDNTTDKPISDIVDNLPKIIIPNKKCVNAFYDTDAVTAQFLILVACIVAVYLTVNIVGSVYFTKLKHLRHENKITKLLFSMNSLALILGWVLYPLIISIYTVDKTIKKETIPCQPKMGDVFLGYLSFVVISLVPVIMYVANRKNIVLSTDTRAI
jgi:amino acid transporter